jgi:hypothetical protein
MELPEPGETINVSARISGVQNLGAFEFDLKYNPEVLQIQSRNHARLGNFLGRTGRNVTPLGPVIDNGTGSLKLGAFTFGASEGAVGAGSLAEITFTVKSAAPSSLAIENTLLTDANAETIPPSRVSSAQLTNPPAEPPSNPGEPQGESGGGAGDSNGCFIHSLDSPISSAPWFFPAIFFLAGLGLSGARFWWPNGGPSGVANKKENGGL